jgi:hypothetical protein
MSFTCRPRRLRTSASSRAPQRGRGTRRPCRRSSQPSAQREATPILAPFTGEAREKLEGLLGADRLPCPKVGVVTGVRHALESLHLSSRRKRRLCLELPEANQAAGDVEERLVNVGAALVADTEAPVLVQPGDRTLDDPAFSAEAGAARALWPSDLRLYPSRRLSSRRACHEWEARSPKSFRGWRRGRPRRPCTGRIPSTSGTSWVMSLRLPAVRETASGVPRPHAIKWCFRAAAGAVDRAQWDLHH